MGVQLVMGAGAVAHVVEAIIAARMCNKRGIKAAHTLGWMAIVLLVGYFGIHSLKQQRARGRVAVSK